MYNAHKSKLPVRLLAGLLALLVLVVPGGISAAADEEGGSSSHTQSLAELLTLISYSDYLQQTKNIPAGTESVILSGDDIIAYNPELTDADGVSAGEYEGEKGLYLPSRGVVGWNITVPAEGMYAIRIRYYSIAEEDSKTTSIERTLYINEKVPFYEARFLTLTKTWKDKDATFQTDSNGDVIYKYQKDGDIAYSYVDKDGNVLEHDISTGKIVFKATGEKVDHDKLISDGYTRYPVYNNDVNRNEIKTDKEQTPEWSTYYCADSTGYWIDALQFHFNEGLNTIQLEAQRESMVIGAIELIPYEPYKSYDAYVNDLKAQGVNEVSDGMVKVQGEYPTATSENTIYANNDRTSYITEPQDASQLFLNVIGGDGGEKWRTVGQWVRYTVNVKESGFYKITIRFKQSANQGTFSSRTVKIATASMIANGQSAEVPFDEAQYAQFNYSDDWQTTSIGNGDKTFMFYFEAGDNYLELHASLGNMAQILRRVEETMTTVNAIYLKILMITGSEPDSNRDYGFYRIMPDDVDELLVQAENLYKIAADIEKMTGTTGSNVATLEKIAILLERMGSKESNIAKNLNNLKENMGTLGTWLQEAKYQPLEIDYIVAEATNVDIEKEHKAKDNFFESIWFEIIQFIRSFIADYNTLGAMEVVKDENVVEVWTTLGRDQAQIIRNLINSDFNANNPGISIEFKLVAGGSLLPSVLAGVGPDVSMGHGAGDVINWAIRSAVVPLNIVEKTSDADDAYVFDESSGQYIMDGLNEVAGAYDPVTGFSGGTFNDDGSFSGAYFTHAALEPLELFAEYEDGSQNVTLYGIPETQSFSMMFYRADVFQQLGLEPPKTWDELISILPTLQRNNMQVALPNSLGGLNLFLYQMGGQLYSENGKAIAFTQGTEYYDTALEAFDYMCKFFSQYRTPYQYSFENRFRTGEMPLGILDYGTYTQLSVYATEIKGLWEFVPLPGYQKVNEDGTISPVNNTSISGVSALIMLHDETRTAEQTANAWKYMKWYVGASNQSAYANELTALLGSVSKHNTANVQALASLSWTTSEYNNLMSQFKNLSAVREYPGGYIIGRYVGFAFLSVYNDNARPNEALESYTIEINKELTRKRKEFGLSYREISFGSQLE